MIIIAPQFPPAIKGGGPVKSLSGISQILTKNKVEHTVITRNRDLGGDLLPEDKFESNAIYLAQLTRNNLKPYFKNTDLVWINTLYSFQFSITPILATLFLKRKTILVSPRGQLLAGALSFKKRFFLKLFKVLLMFSRHNVVIHFTNEDELNNSISIFKKFKNVVFNNPVLGDIHSISETENSNKSIVLGSFGRISPIKNLEFIIALMPSLPSEVIFQIHGAIQDLEYKERLDELIAKHQLTSRVLFSGQYHKEDFRNKARQVDIIVIPSFSENFCHVFFEAIEMRKIVIASTGLPWKEANKVLSKTILSLDSDNWIERIKNISKLNEKGYQAEQKQLIAFYKLIKDRVEHDIIDNFNDLTK